MLQPQRKRPACGVTVSACGVSARVVSSGAVNRTDGLLLGSVAAGYSFNGPIGYKARFVVAGIRGGGASGKCSANTWVSSSKSLRGFMHPTVFFCPYLPLAIASRCFLMHLAANKRKAFQEWAEHFVF